MTYDATSEDAVEYLIEMLPHEDSYEAERLIFDVDGYPCVVESDLLYQDFNPCLTINERCSSMISGSTYRTRK